MTSDHLSALLEAAGATQDDGWSVLGDDRTMTLHAAYQGVALNISRVQKVRVVGELLHAMSARGELTVLCVSDLFAGAVEGQSKTVRAAGFR